MKVGRTPGVDQSEPISPPSVCHSCQPGGLPTKSRHGPSPVRKGTVIHVHMPAEANLFSQNWPQRHILFSEVCQIIMSTQKKYIYSFMYKMCIWMLKIKFSLKPFLSWIWLSETDVVQTFGINASWCIMSHMGLGPQRNTKWMRNGLFYQATLFTL